MRCLANVNKEGIKISTDNHGLLGVLFTQCAKHSPGL